MQGGAVRKLAGLISQRTWVQIPPLQSLSAIDSAWCEGKSNAEHLESTLHMGGSDLRQLTSKETILKYLKFLILMVAMLLMVFAHITDAQLPSNPDESTFGLSINQLPSGSSWGLNLALPYQITENLKGYCATAAQGGVEIRGRYHAEIEYDVGIVDMTFYSDGGYRGQTFRGLGYTTDVGVTVDVVDDERLDIEIGIFGRSGGAFAKPNAHDDLAFRGYAEDELEGFRNAKGKTLAETNPAPTGLGIQNKHSLNLLFLTSFQLPYDIDLGVRFMPELFASAAAENENEPVDQLLLNFSTSYDLSDRVSLGVVFDVGFQRYRDSGTIENDVAGIASINLSFKRLFGLI